MKLPRERVLRLRPNDDFLEVLSLVAEPPTQKRTVEMTKQAKAPQVKP